MTKYEFILQHLEQIKILDEAGIDSRDLRSAQIYSEILRLREEDYKMEYCVRIAAEKHRISEARCWRIIRRMRSVIPAVSNRES